MKRFLALCLVLCSLCGLCGCGKSIDTAAYTTGLLEVIKEANAFSEELESLDQETAFMVYRFSDYGLEPESVMNCAVLRSSGATCEEGAVLVWENTEQAEKALSALQDYVEGQIEANESYRPNEIPKLENVMLKQLNNSVVMIVAADMDAVSKAMSSIG